VRIAREFQVHPNTVRSALNKLEDESYISRVMGASSVYTYRVENSKKWKQSSESDKSPEVESEPTPAAFIRPTLDQVTQYCTERRNSVDAQNWLDHYSSNGWKVGRNSMKDWRAAVRKWEKNGFDGTGTTKAAIPVGSALDYQRELLGVK